MHTIGTSTSSSCATLTRHAVARMSQRGIPLEITELVIEFGRVVCTRGAVIHAVGRKEVKRYQGENIDLSDCQGIQVVCSMDGDVITTYRNDDFRGLRLDRPHRRFRPPKVKARWHCTAAD